MPLGELSMRAWQPTATIATLKTRANFMRKIRSFFEQRDILEVQTPILSQYANPDPGIQVFSTEFYFTNTLNTATHSRTYYLCTSPEYPMKRLLSAGSGPIFQITPVFRNGEMGRLHNPEFTLLEWYRPDASIVILQREVDELLHLLIPDAEPSRTYRYQDLFQSILEIDPLDCTGADLQKLAQKYHCSTELQNLDKSSLIQTLFALVIEPQLGKHPTFVSHFPFEQAMLAQISGEDSRVCERFELYYRGMELANGFLELRCPIELAMRFEKDNKRRQMLGLPPLPFDRHLIAAQRHGLPPCSGVALGVDRLFAIAQGLNHITEAIAFGFQSA